MNDDLQHELDDELLSAYLDDELSADERALVERRLAEDPAARQTLEQLRNVSQAVRELPQQTVERDLRESILQRVAEVDAPRGRVSPRREDASFGETGPRGLKLTIGRTGRGWIWASLAVAAGVLIMVVQPGDDREPNLNEVAQRTGERAKEKAKPASDVAELPVLTAPGSPKGATELEVANAPSPVGRELAGVPAASAPAPTGESSSVASLPLSDQLAIATRSGSDESAPAGALDSAAAPEPAPEMDDDPFVVVHVVTKRAAFQNRYFDRLLADHGIAVEPEAAAEVAAAESSDFSPSQVSSGRMAEQSGPQPGDGETDVEAVLVEAPTQAIISCMAELNRDSKNYLGVSVEESMATDESLDREAPLAKKVATDLEKFNRGIVTPEQKDSFARDKAMYYQFDSEGRNTRGVRSFSGGLGGAVEAKERQLPSTARQHEVDRGRARRVQPMFAEDRRSGQQSNRYGLPADVEVAAGASKRRELLEQLKTPAAADSDRLQVLFVLRPDDEPTPSAAAADRAE